jgi:hypothetical protein
MNRGQQALLVQNLNLLRFLVERTQWNLKMLPKGWKRVPDHLKKRWQSYAQDLGDRAQFNLGWHSARQGEGLEAFKSTLAINSELSQLIAAIDKHGQPKRGKGQPEKKGANPADVLVWERWQKRTSRRQSLLHFVEQAIAAGELKKRGTPESQASRIRTTMKPPPNKMGKAKAKNDWQQSDDMETFAEGLNENLARRSGQSLKKKEK